jgi:hypothetical protein
MHVEVAALTDRGLILDENAPTTRDTINDAIKPRAELGRTNSTGGGLSDLTRRLGESGGAKGEGKTAADKGDRSSGMDGTWEVHGCEKMKKSMVMTISFKILFRYRNSAFPFRPFMPKDKILNLQCGETLFFTKFSSNRQLCCSNCGSDPKVVVRMPN